MKFRIFASTLALITVSAGAHAQASPAASKRFELSAFGGLTGLYTGLNGGKNLSFTAGVDVGFHPIYKLFPSAEFRGSLALDKGKIDSQKSALGGLRVEREYGRLHPYGDFLVGRGQIDYGNGGYPSLTGKFLYADTTSNVISPGAGASLFLNSQLSGFADVQFQHYNTPVTVSGHIWAKAITVGVNYRFKFERRGNPGPYYR